MGLSPNVSCAAESFRSQHSVSLSLNARIWRIRLRRESAVFPALLFRVKAAHGLQHCLVSKFSFNRLWHVSSGADSCDIKAHRVGGRDNLRVSSVSLSSSRALTPEFFRLDIAVV